MRSIEVEGRAYEHDIVIDRGAVRKRSKKPSKPYRDKFGHTPLSADEEIPWGWSWHAYGRAIDVNPLLNPYIDATGAFQPKNAAAYLDRSRADPGLLHSGDPAVHVFTDRGWQWGGYWRSPIDYMHFELP